MDQDLTVVGIGYSAGGIPPLKRFFEHIPKDSRLAFVLVQHLHRLQNTHLKALLSDCTDLSISYIQDSMIMEENHIYLLEPNHYVKIWDNHLYLIDRRDDNLINEAIDIFFTSLAEEKKEKAIGIILSGGGKDGAEGSKKIYAHGGCVLVQAPHSAAFHFLPAHVIEEDDPVAIEEPDALAHTLLKITSKKD